MKLLRTLKRLLDLADAAAAFAEHHREVVDLLSQLAAAIRSVLFPG